MTAVVTYADVAVGDALPALQVRLRREDLVRYAGASGDFNPIHWNERVAREVGLPDVIAHGNLTLAVTGRLLTDWAGDPGALVEFGARFTKPVVVPDDGEGALLDITGVVTEKLEDGCVKVDVTTVSDGQKVLGQARAVLRLA
jgi:acyl dehydratase